VKDLDLMLVIYYYTPDFELYTHYELTISDLNVIRESLGGNKLNDNPGLASSLGFINEYIKFFVMNILILEQLSLVAKELGMKLLETGVN